MAKSSGVFSIRMDVRMVATAHKKAVGQGYVENQLGRLLRTIVESWAGEPTFGLHSEAVNYLRSVGVNVEQWEGIGRSSRVLTNAEADTFKHATSQMANGGKPPKRMNELLGKIATDTATQDEIEEYQRWQNELNPSAEEVVEPEPLADPSLPTLEEVEAELAQYDIPAAKGS